MSSCRTGKSRYRDEVTARRTLAEQHPTDPSSRSQPATRAYLCPLCAGWHLTATTHRPRRRM